MYTVYKITNTINEKYYIGVHKTDNPNDSYMGSGIAIKQAIKKYGKNNFIKEILLITECKTEAYEKEKFLTFDYNENKTYNKKLGGVGGFSKENSIKGYKAVAHKLSTLGGQASFKKGFSFGGINTKNDAKACGTKGGKRNKGKKLSEAHKQAIRESILKKKGL